jgi:predicted esterase
MLSGVHAKRKYPVLVIHGTADNIVPISEAHRCCEVYKDEGHCVEFEELKDYPHFWGRRFDVNAKMWEFFEKHPLGE